MGALKAPIFATIPKCPDISKNRVPLLVHTVLLNKSYEKMILSNSSLSPVRLGVDFVYPLSQQEEQQQEPPTKNLSCY